MPKAWDLQIPLCRKNSQGSDVCNSSKSFSGDLRHNCAPQLCWRFLPPEQDKQSRNSACTFAAARHSLGFPAAEAQACISFWFCCGGKTASVRAGGTAQEKEKNSSLWDFQGCCQSTQRTSVSCSSSRACRLCCYRPEVKCPSAGIMKRRASPLRIAFN